MRWLETHSAPILMPPRLLNNELSLSVCTHYCSARHGRDPEISVASSSALSQIAGDGNAPHVCIGEARRMMVPSLDDQHAIMIECVQNHAPEVMIVDEIGRPSEVAAVRTVKQRGVRVIGSAHGSLESLIKWVSYLHCF